MSEAADPYLFDVGVIALAHTETPVSDTARTYVQQGIRGEIDAIVPYPALFGAHIVLSNHYGFSHAEVSRLMQNSMDAKRIDWYEGMSDPVVRAGFARASKLNIDGWDGYYADVAMKEGAQTILTLDDDFDQVDGIATDVILSPDEFATLNDFRQNEVRTSAHGSALSPPVLYTVRNRRAQ